MPAIVKTPSACGGMGWVPDDDDPDDVDDLEEP